MRVENLMAMWHGIFVLGQLVTGTGILYYLLSRIGVFVFNEKSVCGSRDDDGRSLCLRVWHNRRLPLSQIRFPINAGWRLKVDWTAVLSKVVRCLLIINQILMVNGVVVSGYKFCCHKQIFFRLNDLMESLKIVVRSIKLFALNVQKWNLNFSFTQMDGSNWKKYNFSQLCSF